MDIYKKMYCRLFNRITDILKTNVDDITKEKLIQAQQETEEMFMDHCPINELYPKETTEKSD